MGRTGHVLLVLAVVFGLLSGAWAQTGSVSSVVAERDIDGRVASDPADGYLGIDVRSTLEDGALDVTISVENDVPNDRAIHVRVVAGGATRTGVLPPADRNDVAHFAFGGVACGATLRVVGTNSITRIVYDRSLACPTVASGEEHGEDESEATTD